MTLQNTLADPAIGLGGGGRLGEGMQARVSPKLETPRFYVTIFGRSPNSSSTKICPTFHRPGGPLKIIENMSEVDMYMYVKN